MIDCAVTYNQTMFLMFLAQYVVVSLLLLMCITVKPHLTAISIPIPLHYNEYNHIRNGCLYSLWRPCQYYDVSGPKGSTHV